MGMRVGLFTDRYQPQVDGVSVAVETMRSELVKLGHDVFVIAPKPSFSYKEESPNVIRLPGMKGLWGMDEHYTTFFSPRKLLHQIDKLDLDIFHMHTPAQVSLLGAYCAVRLGKPLVSTYHTDILAYIEHYVSWETLPGTMALTTLTTAMMDGKVEDFRQTASSLKPQPSLVRWHKKMVTNMIIQVQNGCDLVIAPSEKIRLQLTRLKTSARIVTLPTGIDRLKVSASDTEKWRVKLGLESSDKVILFVGRVGTEKNLGLLIQAFDLVAKQEPSAKLVVVGPGEPDDVKAYKAQAGNSRHGDRVIFAGAVARSELGAIYSLATVLGFPSLTDTQSLVVNEAVAEGLPVVMTDKGITEVVIDGENGYFAKSTARDFAAKLLKILTDPQLQKRFSARGEELAKALTVGGQVHKLVDLYQDAVKLHETKTVQAER